MRNYWECLAELYIAAEEDYDDWNTHIYCLCSRVIITNLKPNFECDNKEGDFDFSIDYNQINNNHKILKRTIYICELDCAIILYLVPEDSFLLQFKKDKYFSNYIESNYKNSYRIFYNTTNDTSTLFSKNIISTIIESFVLNDENFITSHCLCVDDNITHLKYNLITSNNIYQINKFDVALYNYKLLQYYRIADYLLRKTLFQFQWEEFWSYNGEYIVWLSWIHNYKNYVDPSYLENTCNVMNETCFNRKTSRILKSVIKKKIHNWLVEINKLNCRESGQFLNPTLSNENENSSSSIIESESITDNQLCSLSNNEESWQCMWQNHYWQQYSDCYELFKQYCVEVTDVLRKVCLFINFANVDKLTLFSFKSNKIQNIFLKSINTLLRNVKNDFITKTVRNALVLPVKSADLNKTISDFEYNEEIIYDGLDKVQDALELMGYSYEHKINICKLKGEVIYKKKNIAYLNKHLRIRKSYMNKYISVNKMDINEEIELVTKIDNSENITYDLDNDSLENINSKDVQDVQDLLKAEEKLSNNGRKNHKKRKRKKKIIIPDYVQENPELRKYWAKRYRLFSKFDEGIKLDYESWFSVTPEKIAKHLADRCRCDLLIDAFCGAGGNTIHFAFTCERVYAIDIDPQKIALARNNARIYGVEDRIEFIIGDFFCVAERLFGDVVFLSPPWGGPSYVADKVFDLQNIMKPKGGIALFETSKTISDNITYYLPKNINTLQLVTAAGAGSKVEVEQNFLDTQLVALTAYYGELVKT